MSVRRLAEAQVQPAGFAFSAENAAWAEATIRKYPKGREQSAVIPLLMRAQEQEGWVTKAAIEAIADMLGMPYIRALEVATFYTQFQLKPVGTRAHVQVCGTTPCMLRGSEALMDVCRRKIHPEQFHTNASGTLSWEEVECLGACVNAPMVMIFKDTYEDLSPEQLAYIIDRFESGRASDVKPGPQIDRVYSAPFGGRTALTSDPEADAAAWRGASASAAPAETTAPSKAAKPVTSAPETDPTLKSPSPVKVAPEAESKPAEQAPVSKARAKSEGGDSVSGSAAASGTAPVSDKDKPKGIERPEAPDDLKLISGVGPKIEATLNGLGIWTYAQVAAWKKAERAWVDSHLKFAGRIEREDWVRQAKALAKGGEAEYIRVFGKKPR